MQVVFCNRCANNKVIANKPPDHLRIASWQVVPNIWTAWSTTWKVEKSEELVWAEFCAGTALRGSQSTALDPIEHAKSWLHWSPANPTKNPTTTPQAQSSAGHFCVVNSPRASHARQPRTSSFHGHTVHTFNACSAFSCPILACNNSKSYDPPS